MSKSSIKKLKASKKNRKIQTRTSDHNTPYPEIPYKLTTYGKLVEEELYKKIFPNLCTNCLSEKCQHAVANRVRVILLTKYRPNSTLGQLGKDIILKIAKLVWTEVDDQLEVNPYHYVNTINNKLLPYTAYPKTKPYIRKSKHSKYNYYHNCD